MVKDAPEKLQKLINSLSIQKKAFLLGYEKNVYKFLTNSKYFILTSLWEDPGFVLIEAAISNSTIISSNCPNGPYEFLNHGNSGYLFENNKEIQLLNSINKFLVDNDIDKKNKCLNAKKNTKNYTMFNHFKTICKILDLN